MMRPAARGDVVRCFLSLLLLCFGITGSLAAQTVDASVCEILANPQSFDGKIVRLKGTVSAGFDEFAVKDATCNQAVNAIWLAYPEGTKGKAGAAALVQLQLGRNNNATPPNVSRSPVRLDKNKDFKQFDSLLSTPYKAGGMCLGCIRYTVTATLAGRLDGVKEAGIVRDSTGKFVSANGYGNLNLYRSRLVLQAVSDVSAHEIDYSKVSPATKVIHHASLQAGIQWPPRIKPREPSTPTVYPPNKWKDRQRPSAKRERTMV
jgi:hypothetical protein